MSDSLQYPSGSDSGTSLNRNCTNVDIINNNSPELQELEDIEKSAQSDINSTEALPENIAHNSRTDLTLNLKSSSAKDEMKCLLCSYTHADPHKVEEHINREHFDVTSPSVSDEKSNIVNLKCPFCSLTFNQAKYLEGHVNVAHENIVSPQKVRNTVGKFITYVALYYKFGEFFQEKKQSSHEIDSTSQLVCPVCGTFTSTSDVELTKHVDSHFSGNF